MERRYELIQNSISILQNSRCFIDQKTFYVCTLDKWNQILSIHSFTQQRKNAILEGQVQLRNQWCLFDCQQYKNLIFVQKKDETNQLSIFDFRSGLTKYTIYSRQDIKRIKSPQQIQGRLIVLYQNYQMNPGIRLYQRLKLIRRHFCNSFLSSKYELASIYFSGTKIFCLNISFDDQKLKVTQFGGILNPKKKCEIIKIPYHTYQFMISSYDSQYLLIGDKLYKNKEMIFENIQYKHAKFHQNKNILLYASKHIVTCMDLSKETKENCWTSKKIIQNVYFINDIILVQVQNEITKIFNKTITDLRYLKAEYFRE